jgi:hypothetical protein
MKLPTNLHLQKILQLMLRKPVGRSFALLEKLGIGFGL